MSWFKRQPAPPAIPPHRAEPVQVRTEHAPKPEAGIEVTEVDTSDMSKTGIFKAWKRLSGQDK